MATTFTREERGALLLKSLAPEVVEAVLTRLGPERGNRLRALMKRLTPEGGPSEALDQVLREIEKLLVSQGAAARKEEVKASKPPVPTEDDASSAGDPLAALSSLEAEPFARALEGENPRTAAVLLNSLPPERAGAIFKRLPQELRREVSVQFSSCVPPSPEVMQRIAQGIVRKARLLKEKPKDPEPDARYRKMADMIRMLDKPERKEVLTALEERESAAATAIKGYLYKFEDLLRIDNRSMQKFLAELDSKNLAAALRGAPPEIKDKVLGNMSQRAQDALNEEIEFSSSIPADQIEQARKLIVDTIQRLDQAGDLNL